MQSMKGDIRSKWGKLTDDHLMQIQGDAQKLIGQLQERYGSNVNRRRES
jgi:uncharacterized protein YjbJ (UPF0337 family)